MYLAQTPAYDTYRCTEPKNYFEEIKTIRGLSFVFVSGYS